MPNYVPLPIVDGRARTSEGSLAEMVKVANRLLASSSLRNEVDKKGFDRQAWRRIQAVLPGPFEAIIPGEHFELPDGMNLPDLDELLDRYKGNPGGDGFFTPERLAWMLVGYFLPAALGVPGALVLAFLLAIAGIESSDDDEDNDDDVAGLVGSAVRILSLLGNIFVPPVSQDGYETVDHGAVD